MPAWCARRWAWHTIAQWHGTDFNPSQAGFAQELAAVAGAGAQWHDDAFADFCARPELPQFDYISLHGIWSWISDANRAVIVDFIRRKLKVGGVLYISYNTLPGWASFAPVRHLLTQHAKVLGADGSGSVQRVEAALGFADQLMATQPHYAIANPSVTSRLKTLAGQDRQYLAHEYFNADWHPMYFADMAQWLQPAKLTYACSATLTDHVAEINLTAEQQTLLAAVPDANLRETVRDFMVNQQFRKDYWVKGPRKHAAVERVEALRTLRVMLTTPRADVPLKLAGTLGEITMNAEVYGPVLDGLADHQVHTAALLEQDLLGKDISTAQLHQAILLLVAAGHVQLVQTDAAIARARPQTERLNAHLLQKSRGSGEIVFLASPVVGGGIAVGRFAQLFLIARAQGLQLPTEWATFAWSVLAAQNQRLIKDGQQLATPEENLAELNAQAQVFCDQQLQLLQALQVI